MPDQTFDEVQGEERPIDVTIDVLPLLLPRLTAIRWNRERLEAVRGDLDFYLDFDRRSAERRPAEGTAD